MSAALPRFEIPAVPIPGSGDRFPVRHIYCVGRNYAEHAKEMGGDASKEPPFFFTKPPTRSCRSCRRPWAACAYPLATKNLHHEIELVVAIGGRGVKARAGARARRRLRLRGRPRHDAPRSAERHAREEAPVGYRQVVRQAAPIAPIHPVATSGHRRRGAIWLDVNGARRQTGDLADMIWDVPHTLAFLSQYYELLPGDLVFTGTPSGVGPVVAGDRLDGGIDGLGTLAIAVAPSVP